MMGHDEMDELKELIRTVGSAGVKGGFLWFVYRLIVRYVPNWQDKIERQRQQIAMWRDLGMTDEEITNRLGWSCLSSGVSHVGSQKVDPGQRHSESGFDPQPALPVDSGKVSDVPRLTGP
jgi:hypothetical protein